MTKTFTKDTGKMIAIYQMRGKQVDIPENESVFVYAGQKNNYYDKQLK
jgi:hypothetical protein